MSDFAYHMEALRKARIIERKNASQYSSGARQVGIDVSNMFASKPCKQMVLVR
jgi:hypothetical protein